MAGHQKYDINTASKEDLAKIPGVDDTIADAIIEFRDSHGWINDLDELTEAEQLNEQEIEPLREWLTVGSGSSRSARSSESEFEPGEDEEMD
jgi:competence protein ComEA